MATSSNESLIRITICVHRKPGMSEADFHHYWANTHGKLAGDWLQRSGVVKYVQVRTLKAYSALLVIGRRDSPFTVSEQQLTPAQYHTTSAHRALAHKMSDAVGRPVLDWDGIADFYVKKYEDFEKAFEMDEYKERIRPDELKFINMDTIRLTVGVEYSCIENGTLVQHDEDDRKF